MASLFVVLGVLALAGLALTVPARRHRRRMRAWELELAAAFGPGERADLLRRPPLGPRRLPPTATARGSEHADQDLPAA